MVTEIQSESVVQKFRVRFRDSTVWVISAVTFRRQVTPEDIVTFYDANNVEIRHVFLRGSEVSAIAPDANLEHTPVVIELQENFKYLAARVDSLENNLIETITRAINAAFAAHGM